MSAPQPVSSWADPHCHTLASDGMVTPAELVAAAVRRGIALIAVCDHDTMRSASETVERGHAAGLSVVSGQECTTAWPAQTHLLGWFLERPVRMGMSVEDTIDAIHDQGGLAVIPHPFMPTYFASMQPCRLRRLIETHTVDGIELIFTAPINRGRRSQLQRFYDAHRERLGAGIGSSDCHFGEHDMARAVTVFRGRTAADFRAAVIAGRTVARTGERRGIPARLLARQQVRSLLQLPLARIRGELQ